MKKLLILGGSDLQVALIKMAKQMGFYIITCDYLPKNPGHKFADEYYNISTVNKEAVYELAVKAKVDGVLAYASDPAAPTAAWVCEKLGLPTNPYEAINILVRKDLFRNFLKDHGFKTPQAKSFASYEPAKSYFKSLKNNAVIKPVDSSGSKGVFKLSLNMDEFNSQFEVALSYSKISRVIIEEYIEKNGYQIGGDGLLIDGKLVFRCFGDIHFSDTNPMLPYAVSVPSLHSNTVKNKVHLEIQNLLSLLGMKIGGLNFDVLIDEKEDVYILEIGPRNGGNMLPELINFCTNIDMRKYAIQLALGMEVTHINSWQEEEFYSHFVIHSKRSGKVNKIKKSKLLDEKIIYEHLNFEIGDEVRKFKTSADRLGIFLLKFSNEREMKKILLNMDDNFKLGFE